MSKIEKQTAIVSVYMLFMKNDNEALMARRINKKYMSNHYTIPTGHVDNIVNENNVENETPLNAVIRESFEEVGAVVVEKDIEHILTQFKPSIDGPEPRICLYFKINKWRNELINKETDQADNFGFYSLTNPPSPLMPELVSAFKAITEKRSFDEFGYR